MDCPRCGSPVMLWPDRWECGWCLDSGVIFPPLRPAVLTLGVRILCHVDFAETWQKLTAELEKLVPGHSEGLLPLLGKAAVHQLSLAPFPEGGTVEPSYLARLRDFLAEDPVPGLPSDTFERLEKGEVLFRDEGALSDTLFGTFWQALLPAAEQTGVPPWEADPEFFFRHLAVLRGWRRGGPGNDPDYPANWLRLQDAFYARWLALHPGEET